MTLVTSISTREQHTIRQTSSRWNLF